MGGQPVNLTDEPYSYRRSIYGYVDRGNLPELMQSFDFSNPNMPNSKRTTTVVPQQALFLMNSPMAIDVARAITDSPLMAKVTNTRDKIYYTYRTVFQRAPSADETEQGLKFVNRETWRGSQYHGLRESDDREGREKGRGTRQAPGKHARQRNGHDREQRITGRAQTAHPLGDLHSRAASLERIGLRELITSSFFLLL